MNGDVLGVGGAVSPNISVGGDVSGVGGDVSSVIAEETLLLQGRRLLRHGRGDVSAIRVDVIVVGETSTRDNNVSPSR